MLRQLFTRVLGPSALVAVCIAAPAAGAPPRQVSLKLQVDNYCAVYRGSASGAGLTPVLFGTITGPGANAIPVNTTTTDDYLYLATWSDQLGGQGLLVQATVDGLMYFADSGRWEVCAVGASPSGAPTTSDVALSIASANAGGGPSGGWVRPTIGGTNTGTFPAGNAWPQVSQINPAARWMWYDSGQQPGGGGNQPPFYPGFNHDEFLIFRFRLSCVDPPSGMAAWYAFDESSVLDTAYDSAGAAHGAKMNGPLLTPGKVGLALEFGLNGPQHRHVRVPHDPALNLGAGSGGFAIDAWVFPVAGTGQQVVLNKSALGAGGGYALLLNGGTIPGMWVMFPGGTSTLVQASSGLTPGRWNHLAVNVPAVSGGGGTIQYFINGAPLAPQAFARPLTSASTTDLFIGTFDGANNPFLGRLDEVELFTRNLTATEIRSIYDAGPLGKCNTDCNRNGRADAIDIQHDPSLDLDSNGIIDACECDDCLGDANGDGIVNFADITTVLANWLQVCP